MDRMLRTHPYGKKEESSEACNPESLMKLALKAVPQPGETARAFLPPWHSVRMELEEREFQENRKKWQLEHVKKFRYVMEELRWVDDFDWTWSLFPNHVVPLSQSNQVIVLL